MKFALYILFGLVLFLISVCGFKKYRNKSLFALAIGGVVNANFFHAGSYPIEMFGLPFGIDSIIYTLFVYCVIVMYFYDGKKSANVLAFSSIIAIVFSALMQLASDLFAFGSSIDAWKVFFTFMASVVASVVAIIVVLEVLDRIKNKVNNK